MFSLDQTKVKSRISCSYERPWLNSGYKRWFCLGGNIAEYVSDIKKNAFEVDTVSVENASYSFEKEEILYRKIPVIATRDKDGFILKGMYSVLHP